MSSTIGIKEALIEYLEDHVINRKLTLRQVADIEKLFVNNEQQNKEQMLKDFFDAGYDYRSSLLPEIKKDFGEVKPDFQTFISEYDFQKNSL